MQQNIANWPENVVGYRVKKKKKKFCIAENFTGFSIWERAVSPPGEPSLQTALWSWPVYTLSSAKLSFLMNFFSEFN